MAPHAEMSAEDAAPPAATAADAIFLLADMPEEARLKCVEYAVEALAKHKVEKDQAMHVKKALEAWNGAMWVVVVGTAFGASVAHENAGLCMFRLGRAHVLAFQSFDEGALINTKKAARGGEHAKKEEAEEEGKGAEEPAA